VYRHLNYSVEDKVTTVALNRPESLNAFDLVMAEELADCLSHCADDMEIRALIVKGEGRFFSVGGDIKQMQQASSRPYFLRMLTMYLHTAISTIWRMPKPVIAAVHGAVTGLSFALTLACDLIVAAEGTKFGTSYLAIGLSPDGGTTFLLPRIVGLHKSKYVTFTNDMIDATTAYHLGFVNQVVKGEELMVEAKKIAKKLASAPPLAIAKTKELFNSNYGLSLETQMELERNAISFTSGTADFEEGLSAFFGKRSPIFKGR
jgi:2-(1,2-epoxy-1,2-dihydrophenyl)acetyl-CoA isomerase